MFLKKRGINFNEGRKNWGSNKNSRRSLVAKDYRIVMMFGDNLGDFIDGSDNKNSSEHRMAVTKNISRCGAIIGLCSKP